MQRGRAVVIPAPVQFRLHQADAPGLVNHTPGLSLIAQSQLVGEVGRRLGINQTNVSRWVREYRQENEPSINGEATRSELEAEVKRLRKETERLRMEREILKKAAAFFANESN